MIRRRKKRSRRDPLLLREYERQLNVARFWILLGDEHYPEWLERHGIDPKTGRMTKDGLGFYKQLLDEKLTDRGTRNAA